MIDNICVSQIYIVYILFSIILYRILIIYQFKSIDISINMLDTLDRENYTNIIT